MVHARAGGFSLIEILISLALVAGVTAALLPAVALSARLQQASAIETEASVIAATRIEYLKADLAAGLIGIGGDVDAARDGWHAASASFDCRWRIAPASTPAGVWILTVRVVPMADSNAAVSVSVAVPDE